MPGQKLVIVSASKENNATANNSEEELEGNGNLSASDEKPIVNTTPNADPKTKSVVPVKAKSKKKTVPQSQPDSKFVIYIVQPGDTLASIAKRYDGISIAQLKSVNRITNVHNIKAGTKLKVPVSS